MAPCLTSTPHPQVPQFILEQAVAAGRGGVTSIIVTQVGFSLRDCIH